MEDLIEALDEYIDFLERFVRLPDSSNNGKTKLGLQEKIKTLRLRYNLMKERGDI